jgi:SET domain-containing protein
VVEDGQVTCRNRKLQKGMSKRLELVRTEGKGWGVVAAEVCAVPPRTCTQNCFRLSLHCRETHARLTHALAFCVSQNINAGDFVIEYVGEHISAAEAERRKHLSSLADTYMMEIGGGGRGGGVVIDAFAMRNLAACINFSCEPNLEFRPVGTAHGDRRIPRVGFFARRDIKVGDELGYLRDASATSKSKWSTLQCMCGAKTCRGWL